MADGYIVQVTNPGIGKGPSMIDVWYAHIPDMAEAVDAVRKPANLPGDIKVESCEAISHKVLVDELRVPEGGVKKHDPALKMR